MKRLALITNLPFWYPGAGDRTRVLALVAYFSRKYTLSVIVLRRPGAWGKEHEEQSPYFRNCFSENPVDLTILSLEADAKAEVKRTLFRSNAEAVIFVHLHLVEFLPSVPPHVRTLIDVIDLLSERSKTHQDVGKTSGNTLSFDQEAGYLDKFDAMIAIKEVDYQILEERFGEERVILSPPAVRLPRQQIREKAGVIGFVSGNADPNYWAIQDFIENVWPHVKTPELELRIFGPIAERLEASPEQNIKTFGFFEIVDAIYQQIDIVLNPVTVGAGIKLKSIEALVSGLPLVTSEHSAEGLNGEHGKTYFVAGTPVEFQTHLRTLAGSYGTRLKVGEAGYDLAQKYFSPEACFASLDDFLAE